MWHIAYLYGFCVALALGLAATPLAMRLAARAGVVDIPDERKSHRRPTPLLGGAAVAAAVAVPLLIGAAAALSASRGLLPARLLPAAVVPYLGGALSVLPKLLAILLGGFTIFLIGLWDDVSELRPRAKLLGQFLTALGVVALDVRITLFSTNYLLGGLLTVAWIVCLTNAFNLLDNMDGLCAGVAFIASVIFFGVSALRENYFIAMLLAVFAGGLLGFLRYNFSPARIFLGDAGSMFIGYFLAVLTVMQTYYGSRGVSHLAVLMPLVILAVPLYDTASVIVIRTLRGESIFKADRRHFSHRLVGLGMSPRGAVLFIYLVTLATGLSAMLLPAVGWHGGALVVAQTLLIVSLVAILEYFGGRRAGNE